WRIQPAFQAMVRFEVVNIVSPEAFAVAGSYDLVLCRNLLIYLHTDARAVVMTKMVRLLKNDGVLIVGHAEAGLAREHGFRSVGDPKAFAFTHNHNHPQVGKPIVLATRRQSLSKRLLAESAELLQAPAPQPTHPTAPTLDQVRRMGDQGRTEEAIRE